MVAPAPVAARDVVVLRLAEGGMGYVELVGRQEGRFSRLFARKRLHAHLREDAAFRAMLLDEARVAGLIRHPNVTAVLEVGEDDEGPFLLMEYVEGPSVAQILERVEPRDRLLPVALCVTIAAQAARGLHAAHQLESAEGVPLGVVHRDISPKNLLVGYDGLVRVADFGIAKAKDNLEQTRVGVLKGNIGYMAPEYLSFQDLDGRSDLFALGVVLYELLARERLFGGDDTAAIARRILSEPPPDIFEVRDVPAELAALLFDLLAKTRELRPPDAMSVATRLDWISSQLASVDGPFDLGGFLQTELGELRGERRSAIDAALAKPTLREASRGPRSSVPPAGDVSASVHSELKSRPSARTAPPGAPARQRRWLRPLFAAGATLLLLAAGALPAWHAWQAHRAPVFVPGKAELWAGSSHNCALAAGQLWCWGSDARAQIGDGQARSRAAPTLAAVDGVHIAALGEYHSCVLKAGGKVACWGRNVRAEVGHIAPSPVKLPSEVAGVENAIDLVAGRQHTCALVKAGKVMCWGANESGQLGRPPSESEAPGVVPDLPAAERIFAGGSNTCALTQRRGLLCWGADENGQLGDSGRVARATPRLVPGTEEVQSVAIGNGARAGSRKADLTQSAGFMCALTRQHRILCWGSNYTAQLGDGSRIDRETPAPVVSIVDAIQVAVGDMHGCALLRSGSVRCWGRNEFGGVGDGTLGPSTVRPLPLDVLRLNDVVGLALGGAHSCARRRDGAILCWGLNNAGQVGNGAQPLQATPIPVSGLP